MKKRWLGINKKYRISIVIVSLLIIFIGVGYSFLKFLNNDNKIEVINKIKTVDNYEANLVKELGLTFEELNTKYNGVKSVLYNYQWYEVMFNESDNVYYFGYQLSEMGSGLDINTDINNPKAKCYALTTEVGNYFDGDISKQRIRNSDFETDQYEQYYVKDQERYRVNISMNTDSEGNATITDKNLEKLASYPSEYQGMDYPLLIIGKNYSQISTIFGRAIYFARGEGMGQTIFRNGYSYYWDDLANGDGYHYPDDDSSEAFNASPIAKNELKISQYNTSLREWLNIAPSIKTITKDELAKNFTNLVWDCKMAPADDADCGDDNIYKTCTISGEYKGYYFRTINFMVDDLKTQSILVDESIAVGKEKAEIYPPNLRC